MRAPGEIELKIRNLYRVFVGKDITDAEYFELENSLPYRILSMFESSTQDGHRLAVQELHEFLKDNGFIKHVRKEEEDVVGVCVSLDEVTLKKSNNPASTLLIAEKIAEFCGIREQGELPTGNYTSLRYVRLSKLPEDVPSSFIKWNDVTKKVESMIVRLDETSPFSRVKRDEDVAEPEGHKVQFTVRKDQYKGGKHNE